jgi:hypothetical protein
LFALLAAAVIGLLAAGGVSCVGASNPAAVPPPTPDTLALVEGLELFERGDYDLAREQFRVSALSESTWIRAESFLYLNALEMELGNYDAAGLHLNRYHAETMRLMRDSAERMARQTARLRRRQETIVVVGIVFAAMVVGGGVWLGRPRRRVGQVDNATALSAVPAATPWQEGSFALWMASAESFKQTPLWDEIAELAAQRPGREARVLTTARQEVLDAELAGTFAGFAETLRAEWPALTGGDVKLCCLSLLPLSPFGRALCFGSVETNIIKQRKHTIKKKLVGDGRGREMFEFIFSPR